MPRAHSFRILRSLLPAALPIAIIASCTVKEGEGDGVLASGSGPTSSGVGGTAGTDGSGAGGSQVAAGGLNATGMGGVLVGIGGSGGTGAGGACEAEVSVADQVGLDMYIVFDRSGSMAERPPPNNGNNGRIGVPDGAVLGDCPIDLANPPAQDSKWCLASNALAGFFATDPRGDVRAALQFMTPAVPENTICGADAGNPHAMAAVDLTPLPVAETDPLIAALEAEVPHTETINGVTQAQSGTRVEGALNGIAMYTAANVDPERRIIGVLISDGEPYNCDQDIDNLAQLAVDHFTANDIPTFFIGMTGAVADQLETMAANAGGPEHGPEFCEDGAATCHYWSVGDGDATAFTAVLNAIKDSVVIPCEYTIPTPSQPGQSIDPNLINVTYNDGSGNPPVSILKVADEASCDPATGGWFFDDPAAPRAVRLCPNNCEVATAAPVGAAVEILYGCTTIVP